MKELEVIVPKLYEDLEAGVLVEWFKREGDYIKIGDIIFSLETEKSVFEIESEFEGCLKKIIIGNGNDVKPLDIVGIISSEKE